MSETIGEKLIKARQEYLEKKEQFKSVEEDFLKVHRAVEKALTKYESLLDEFDTTYTPR